MGSKCLDCQKGSLSVVIGSEIEDHPRCAGYFAHPFLKNGKDLSQIKATIGVISQVSISVPSLFSFSSGVSRFTEKSQKAARRTVSTRTFH
jgi:hypothetical protein